MIKNIKPNKLKGNVYIPPSKSMAHRAIICASVAKGKSFIDNIELCNDVSVTLDCVKNLGAEVILEDSEKFLNRKCVTIKGIKETPQEVELNCGESGSALRFLIPIACSFDNTKIFSGHGKLPERPIDTYYKFFKNQNMEYKNLGEHNLPLKVEGKLNPGIYEIPGDISSQYITGLLLALPLLDGASKILITSPLESGAYVDMTLDVMKHFGINVIEKKKHAEYIINQDNKYSANNYNVEGDWSAAGFYAVAGAICGDIRLFGLNMDSKQPDKAIMDVINNYKYNEEENYIYIAKNSIKSIHIDASQFPDMVPILSVLCIYGEEDSIIENLARLRIKECDRLEAIKTEMNKLGAKIEIINENLHIKGLGRLKGGNVDSWNDHRMAMSAAIASIICDEEVTIEGSESVKKSYVNFWEDFVKLGGIINE